uniref:Uncharacterized protein n=1 Tax=Meloidogyne enterolobii TaxID=390850 RepID=A0A6V7TUJ4_MELEN|nr:unnamed protein product [Meloidogyne enterolobii]
MQLATENMNNRIIFTIFLVISLKISSIVEGYPSTTNFFDNNRLTSRLLNQLFEQQIVRRFDPAWRHIGLGKRSSNKRQLRGTREQQEETNVLNKRLHLALIGLGRK